MKKSSKWLALMLVFMMLFNMVPTTVFAANIDVPENSIEVTAVSEETADEGDSSISLEDFQFSALTKKTQDYLDEIALTLEKDENGQYVLYVPAEGVASYVDSASITLQIAAPEGYNETFSVDFNKYVSALDSEGSHETVISDRGIVHLNQYATGTTNDDLNYSEQITVYFTETEESYNIKLVPYCNVKALMVAGSGSRRPVGQRDATTFYTTIVKGTTAEITAQATIKPNSTDGVSSTVIIDGQEAETITYTADNEVGDVKEITIQIEDEHRGLVPGTYTLQLKTIETDLYPVVEFDNKKLTVNVGETVELNVNATNLHGTTTYRWQAGVPANYFDINEPSITLDTSKAANYTMTRCTVSNIVDGLTYSTSTKAKTVTVASNATAQPEILSQPFSGEYVSGLEAAPLTLEAKGTVGGKLTYQWYSNTVNSNTGGTAIAGAKQVNYVPNTSVVGTFYYYCEVVDTVNRIASAPKATECVKVEVILISNDLSMDGEGTAEKPYLITNTEDLVEIRDFVDKGYTFKNAYFQFTNDITLPEGWDPIGSNPIPNEYDTGKGMYIRPFSGTLDGNNYTVIVPENGLPLFDYVREATIKNLNIKGTKIAGYGLINDYCVDYGTDGDYSTGDPATPETVTIENCTIKSGTSIKYSGFIGGYASGKNYVYINNCTVEDEVIIGYVVLEDPTDRSFGAIHVGSLAGSFNGYVTNCTSAATVYSKGYGGGLIGAKGQSMGPCQVLNSSFTGTVIAENAAGGIIGAGYNCDNTPIVTIQNCYVNASLTGGSRVGGILGGEGGCIQCWSNGTGGVTDNVFIGTLKATEDNAYVGGIIGYMHSLNVGNKIQNNYYLEGSADKGIGFAKYIDTSAEHETETDALYFDSSVALPDVRGIVKKNLNRNDDPMGKDADKLAMAVSIKQLEDGTVTNLLNNSDTSLHNWITDSGKGHPVQSSEPIPFKLEVSGEYKDEYIIDDELDLSGLTFVATWSDGTTTEPKLEDITVTGYDKTTRGQQTVTLTYGAAKAEIKVIVFLPDGEISVNFAILGDINHDSDSDKNIHTLTEGNLTTWVEAKDYVVDNNMTVLELLEKVAKENNMTYSNPSGNYIESITYQDVTIGEFTNGKNSGWMYTLNDVHSDLGVSEQYMNDGDVIVFHYTDDYTAEKNDMTVIIPSDVIELINAIGDVTVDSKAAINAAREAYTTLSKDQRAEVTNYDVLLAAEKALKELKNLSVTCIYEGTGEYLKNLANETTPTVNSIGGEWLVLGLVRSEKEVPAGYYENVVNYVKENINENNQLHRSKSTDNSRVILALTAAGYDVTNVGGYNLLEGLTDMNYVEKQGINGPIWALIAFDSHDYEIPAGGDVAREKVIETILAAQTSDGGWNLDEDAETADPDMTGMAIQALAPYYESNEKVKAAVDKALAVLSKLQEDTGAFVSSDDVLTSESTAQVLVALTALGIDPAKDERFIKEGNTIIDGLIAFAFENGGFRHVLSGDLDGMATEQGYYALVSYVRMLAGQTTLYDMSDVAIDMVPGEEPGGSEDEEETDKPSGSEDEEETEKPGDSEDKEETDKPDTGDHTPIWLCVMAAMASLLVVYGTFVLRKKEQ